MSKKYVKNIEEAMALEFESAVSDAINIKREFYKTLEKFWDKYSHLDNKHKKILVNMLYIDVHV